MSHCAPFRLHSCASLTRRKKSSSSRLSGNTYSGSRGHGPVNRPIASRLYLSFARCSPCMPAREKAGSICLDGVSAKLCQRRTDGYGTRKALAGVRLGARRPILALAPKRGAAAELIREADAGAVVDSRNPPDQGSNPEILPRARANRRRRLPRQG